MAPIINLDKTQESEPAFFRMYDGKLVIEQLEFVLEPDQENFKNMAVVFMGGNASCTFKNVSCSMSSAEAFSPSSPVRYARMRGATSS